MLCPEAAAAVGSGQYLQIVAIGVFEIDAAAIVPMIDPAWLPVERIGPDGQAAFGDAGEDGIELGFRNLEGEMARSDLAVRLEKIERGVADLDDGEMTEPARRLEAEQLGQESCARRRIMV